MSTTYGPLTVYSPNGNGGVSTSATWSTQFSVDNESKTFFGNGVHAYAGFNSLTVTVVGGQVVSVSVYVYTGAEALGIGSVSYNGGSYVVKINGTTFYTAPSYPAGTTVTYTYPGDGPLPQTIELIGSINATVDTQTTGASLDVLYKLYAQTANLVFSEYDSQIGNSQSTYNFKMLFLEPPSVSNHGKLISVKDKSFQASTMVTAIYTPQGIPIEGNAVPGDTRAFLTVNGQCNTYIVDNVSSTYRVANIYPGHNQIALPTMNPSGLTPVAASGSIADIFSTDSTPGRTTVDNLVELPAVSNPTGIGSLKIIIYGGRTSAKYTGNVLVIQEPSGGNFIDNTYGTTAKPYLQTDASTNANEKNTGIVFISNENQWFVLGYYETSPWTWETTAPSAATKTIPNNTLQFDIISAGANDMISAPTVESLSLVKTQTVSGSAPYVVFRQQGGGSTFNENGQFVYYTGDPTNSTAWLLAYAIGGGDFKNYIVLSYTPN